MSTERRAGSHGNSMALGLLETRGLSAAFHGADAMCKAASVRIVRVERVGSAYITVLIMGDVGAVNAALGAGAQAAATIGHVVAAHVIARPNEELVETFGLHLLERSDGVTPAPGGAR
ncbi:MAG: microcompartment protein [Myxococcaceae bacterium]|nr:microcompartment protein [Myxococcaceae bacterium]